MRNALPTLIVVCALLPLSGHAVPPTDPLESQRMMAIRSLRLDVIPGPMPTFYSPRARNRAKYLQGIFGGEIAYYARVFHENLRPVTMAVLDSQQWPQVAGAEPYGMPSVEGTNPPVFVMPASWEGVKWMAVPGRDQVPPRMLHEALADGKTWAQVRFEGCDGIGTHEVGHSITRQLEIDPQTHWFSEFLASYVGYAYLKAKHPGQALSNELFWSVGLAHSPHAFTSLDDFESRYDELQQKYPGNYGWYQLALDQRVMAIYRRSGVDYLRTVREQFPSHGPKLDSHQVLEKLEAMNPGWQEWAVQLQAGQVTVNRSTAPLRDQPAALLVGTNLRQSFPK